MTIQGMKRRGTSTSGHVIRRTQNGENTYIRLVSTAENKAVESAKGKAKRKGERRGREQRKSARKGNRLKRGNLER